MTEPVRLEHQERVRDFYRNQGKATERERIIKLLEENLRYVHHEGLVIGTTIANVEDVIALIKGETDA